MKNYRKTSIITLLVVIVFAIIGCGDKTAQVTGVDPLYPTSIVPLSATDLTVRINDFRTRYPRVCSDLDEYGYPVRKTGPGPSCFSQVSAGIDLDASQEPLINLAKLTLVDMLDFTGVSDHEGLTVSQTSTFQGSPYTKSYLTVRFNNQRYEGREVLSTQLIAWVDSLGVIGVSGHHYASIYLPKTRFYSNFVKKRLLGMEIPWYDTLGIEHTFVVTEDSFLGEPIQVVHPKKVNDTIELRIAWEIEVGSGVGSWHVYIDTVTGEHLSTIQLFNT